MDAELAFQDLLESVDALLPIGPDGRLDTERARLTPIAELLAYLAARMTDLHGAREAEAARFLAWLEEQMDCTVDDLTGKTGVVAYYGQPDGVEALLDTLQRNRRRTGLDVGKPRRYGARNDTRDRIVEGFELSISRLAPLAREIELTDRLIDLIVYRVYGLTPEQRRIVDRQTGWGGSGP